jgi:hypothetical protein
MFDCDDCGNEGNLPVAFFEKDYSYMKHLCKKCADKYIKKWNYSFEYEEYIVAKRKNASENRKHSNSKTYEQLTKK